MRGKTRDETASVPVGRACPEGRKEFDLFDQRLDCEIGGDKCLVRDRAVIPGCHRQTARIGAARASFDTIHERDKKAPRAE
jgi:hypothetical protein